jgi:hypothetical protein
MSQFESTTPPEKNHECGGTPSGEAPLDWYYPYSLPQRPPHSIYGIISCTLALLSCVVFCMLVVVIGFLATTAPELYGNPKNWDEESPPLILLVVGIGIWGCIFATFAAFILGVVGAFQPHTRKVFSLLGIFFSAVPLLLLACFVTLGIILMLIGGA